MRNRSSTDRYGCPLGRGWLGRRGYLTFAGAAARGDVGLALRAPHTRGRPRRWGTFAARAFAARPWQPAPGAAVLEGLASAFSRPRSSPGVCGLKPARSRAPRAACRPSTRARSCARRGLSAACSPGRRAPARQRRPGRIRRSGSSRPPRPHQTGLRGRARRRRARGDWARAHPPEPRRALVEGRAPLHRSRGTLRVRALADASPQALAEAPPVRAPREAEIGRCTNRVRARHRAGWGGVSVWTSGSTQFDQRLTSV
jgi:hypothetical protein